MLIRSSEAFDKVLPRQNLLGRVFQAFTRLVRRARSGRVTARLLQHFPAKLRRNSQRDEQAASFNEGIRRSAWKRSKASKHLEDEASDWIASFEDIRRRVAKEIRRELGENGQREPKRLGAAGGELTPSDLEALLAQISPDREQAVALYEDIRRWLIGFFKWQPDLDSASLVDEAIGRAARLLAQRSVVHGKWSSGSLRFRITVERVAVEMCLEAELKEQVFDTFARLACRVEGPDLSFGSLITLSLPQSLRSPGKPRERGAGEAGLTHEHLETLLNILSADPEQAGALYEDIRRRLIRLFEQRQLGVDSESLADKTIDRVAYRLMYGTMIHLDRPFGYFWGVAHRVALEVYREAKRRDQAFATFAALHHSEPEPKATPHLPCLQKCLDQLSADESRLIFRYFEEEDRIAARQRLAQDLGIGSNALRIRAHRVRRKLAGCCFHCLEVEAAAHRDNGGGTEGFSAEE